MKKTNRFKTNRNLVMGAESIEIKLNAAYAKEEFQIDETIIKIIENEYATKYLESLNIEPTLQNIRQLLTTKPLSDCQIISGGWSGSGIVAENIYVIPNKRKTSSSFTTNPNSKLPGLKAKRQNMQDSLINDHLGKFEEKYATMKNSLQKSKSIAKEQMGKQTSSGDVDDSTDIDKSGYNPPKLKKSDSMYPTIGSRKNDTASEKMGQKLGASTFHHDYSISTIKRKYIKECDSKNIRFVDKNAIDARTSDKKQTGNIGDSPYIFPFNKNKLTSFILEELQSPFDVSLAEVSAYNQEFIDKFPFTYIPMYIYESALDNKKNFLNESQHSDDEEESKKGPNLKLIQEAYVTVTDKFEAKEVQRLKELLASNEVIRISGLLCHFVYWIVFGLINPLPVDKLSRKQMVVQILQLWNDLQQKFPKEKKLWLRLMCPMLIICFRMTIEYFFRNHYVLFFNDDKYCLQAFQRINLLITDIFDASEMVNHIVYWENGEGKIQRDKKSSLKKKMFAVSPMIEYLYANPMDIKTRQIIINNRTMNPSSKNLIRLFQDEKSQDPRMNNHVQLLNKTLDRKLSQITLEKIFGKLGS